MTPSLKRLGIDRLSFEEKVELVGAIWDDIAAIVDSEEISPVHRELLDRRVAAHEATPEPGSTWNEIKTRLDERRGARR